MKLASTPQRAAPTDKCTASRNVLDSIDQWRLLFERSALGVAMINSAFHFLMANPAFLTMFGYSSEELQQLSLLDICIDEDGRRMSQFLYANCARACVFSMRSKHNTVAKTELSPGQHVLFSR